MGRRYWFINGVLALAAALSQWLVWLTRERPDAQTYAGPPRSDYTLQDFTLTALDRHGQAALEISGPQLARRGDDGSIYVTTPDYVVIDGGGHSWRGRSEAAWVDRDGDLMQLQGAVHMQRESGGDDPPIDIATHDLTVRLREKTLETAARATITQPGSILSGVGLRGDLEAKTLELLSDVHSTLQPQRRPRRTQAH